MTSIKTVAALAVMSVASLFASQSAEAQDLKFAHINSQKILTELPEAIAAQNQLQEEAKKLQDQMAIMNSEAQQKMTEYISKRDSLPELIRATKEKEIQDMQERIQSFQQLAQQSLSQKEQQLLSPIIEKVNAAIDAVGKENNFIYIFDTASQVILYNSEQSVDAEPLVKAKLGVK